jgi:UDP-N-acetylmuramoyl-L-alanyl-D-glutamate--2,6-diaminopimelate ligase
LKKLTNLIKNLEPVKIIGNTDIEINDICFDSRKVTTGSLFVAIKGNQSDGHDYIENAIKSGATAIVAESIPESLQNLPTASIVVSNSAKALGLMASCFYDNPSAKLTLVGVTGTNGKTTIATLLYHLFRSFGYKCGLLSTVVNMIERKTIEATHTTGDAMQINKLLADMVKAGVQYCFMEVSSHAIDQHRVTGLEFNGGIFTNLTHDHLDYHKDFSNYRDTKKRFFDTMPSSAFALVNGDDKNGMVMLQNTKAEAKTYGLKSMTDFKAKILELRFDGTLLNIDGNEVWTQLIGEYNTYNIMAVYAAAVLLKQDTDEILKNISALHTVSGRFEYLKSKNNIVAIVDYAHTPDAIENVLKTIRQIKTHDQHIITVVGAGGNRDKTKRPVMAKVAAENSSKVILTSDNPRNEKPEDILKDMKAGIEDFTHVAVIVDRKEAIKMAYMLANPNDIILIAGKGHETYQEIDGVKHHFDDKEVIGEIFENEE